MSRPSVVMFRGLAVAALFVLGCSASDETCTPSFRAVDRARMCLGPLESSPCYSTSGPPKMECSVTPSGTAYVSSDGRLYPGARACTSTEREAWLVLTDCSGS